MTHTEGWSWFDAPELSDVDLAGHDVTAVLVCRNAGAWLNATLAGLGQLDHRPDVILAVDNESTDDTAELLDGAYEAGLVDEIVTGKATFSFGEAVERALSVVDTPTKWIWLLHDDAIPDHAALTELLTLAARTPRLAIAVPLSVRPSRRTHAARTLEIGATISRSGRRILGLEPEEVAQGQYESTSVLGGSTAGMLVRWQSLIELGGFDPCISGYRDGIDIGWRAQLIDQWVLTCPKARIVHREAGRSEIRRGTLASQAGRSESAWDRLMGLRLVAAHAHGLGTIPHLLYLTLVCWFGALAYVLGRAPDHAKDELQAWADLVFRSHKRVVGLRRRIRKVSLSDTRVRVRALRPTLGSMIEVAGQNLARWFHDQFASRRDSEISLDDLLGDEFTRRIGEGRRRIPAGVWLVLLLAGVGVMARTLYRNGLVVAPGLLGAPETLGLAFQRALSAAGRSEPWLLVSAAASALTVRPTWFPVVLLVLAFPLLLLVGVWFGRRRIDHGTLRWLAAAGYALLPIVVGGLNRGSLWLVAAALLLPFLAEWLSRLDTGWLGARSLQSLAGIALAGVLIVAITPALWVPVVVVAVIWAVRANSGRVVVWTVVFLIIPVVFWARALPAYWQNPVRLILAPEPLLTPGVSAPLWQMLFARPVGIGLPPLWLSIAVTGVVWLGVLVVAVVHSWRRWPILAGIGLIAAGVWLARLDLRLLGSTVHADPSVWLLAGFALLLYALISWMDETLGSLEGRDFGGKQALVAVLSLLLVGAFLLGSGWAAYAGMAEVRRTEDARIPEYLAQNERLFDTATLIIDAPAHTWNVRAGGQTLWGQGTFRDGVAGSDPAAALLQQIVARAIAGRPDDTVTAQLGTLGISTVVVMQPTSETVTALDTTVGLQRTTSGGGTEIWSVTVNGVAPTRRALVTTGDPPVYLGAGDPVPPGSPRTLVLAVPPDPERLVYVGGVQVNPVTSGDWRAAYALSSTAGPIEFRTAIDREWLAWVQLGMFVLLIIFVFPPMTDDPRAADGPRYQMRSAR